MKLANCFQSASTYMVTDTCLYMYYVQLWTMVSIKIEFKPFISVRSVKHWALLALYVKYGFSTAVLHNVQRLWIIARWYWWNSFDVFSTDEYREATEFQFFLGQVHLSSFNVTWTRGQMFNKWKAKRKLTAAIDIAPYWKVTSYFIEHLKRFSSIFSSSFDSTVKSQ